MCSVDTEAPRMCFELEEVPSGCPMSDSSGREGSRPDCVSTVLSLLLCDARSPRRLAGERRDKNVTSI